MQVSVRNISGEVVSELQVSDHIFSIPANTAVMHQAMVAQLNNARLGTANTKTRGQVAGSTKKLYPQKHTGRARRGSIKSPLLRGGGIVFGPHPRSYHQNTNRKMKSLALRSALSSKASEGKLLIVDQLNIDSAKTRDMANLLQGLGITSSVLVVATGVSDNLRLASRNIPRTRVIQLDSLNLVDLLSYQHLIMTVDAVKKAQELWGIKKTPAQAESGQKE